MSEEDDVGLSLFPDDGDIASPDADWSYNHFAAFRQRLAEAEGFSLSDMWGFGGDRPWSEVVTELEPLLDHPDDRGELSATECAAILPRLESIIDQWQREAIDIHQPGHVADGRRLVAVLHFCVKKNVALLFG